MPDMLVKLYELPEASALLAELREAGVIIRPALAAEKHIVVDWVRRTFSPDWVSECEVAIGNQPVSCFVAIKEGQVIGFSCYDATYRGFLGPIGVSETQRERGVGKGLLLACLHAMAALGYGYAIIGGAGPTEFYRKTVGAVEIEGSSPGIYRGMLQK
jgi:ribosomal protein S18 acetylase RimI-like enzyme